MAETAPFVDENGNRIMAVGPLATVIPEKLHRHISKNILKSFLSCTHEYTTKLQKDVEPANIPVITRKYDEQLYPAVANKLNDLGREFLVDVHPWVLNTLIDWDELDHKICTQDSAVAEGSTSSDVQLPQERSSAKNSAGAEGSTGCHVQLPQESSSGKNSVVPLPADEETKQTSATSNVERHEWNDSETKLLLDTTAENMEKLKGAKNKTNVWSSVADVLVAHGFNVTVTQCIDRYKYMKRSYKAYVDKSKKSGSGKCSFKFEKEMHALIGDDPAVKPLCTFGSGDKVESTDLDAEESDESPGTSTPASEPKRPRRRSMINELKDLMEERDQRLLSAMEKMNNEQNELLKKLIDKL